MISSPSPGWEKEGRRLCLDLALSGNLFSFSSPCSLACLFPGAVLRFRNWSFFFFRFLFLDGVLGLRRYTLQEQKGFCVDYFGCSIVCAHSSSMLKMGEECDFVVTFLFFLGEKKKWFCVKHDSSKKGKKEKRILKEYLFVSIARLCF